MSGTSVEKTQQNGVAAKPQTPMAITKSLFAREEVKQKFQEMLGKRATSYITSILQIVASNELLIKADPESIYHSAVVAATLDLPLNNNLGFAYIVPYGTKAQFQLGYKGFIQLAQRTGLFKTISVSPIYEGQLIEENPLTGFLFDFTKKTSEKVIGYAAYFSLLNGFEKTLYMSAGDVERHGKKFSQTYKRGFGIWKDDFDSMAMKTVLKLLLGKYAPLSVDIQKAVITDQAIINDVDATDITYVDNTPEVADINKEEERIAALLSDAKTEKDLHKIIDQLTPEQKETHSLLINNRVDSFLK